MSDPHPQSAHGRYLAAMRRVQELEQADAQAPAPDTSLEDTLVRALARDRRASMPDHLRNAAELEDAKAALSAATDGLQFSDLEKPPRDWDPDDWSWGPEPEPTDGLVAVLDRLKMLK